MEAIGRPKHFGCVKAIGGGVVIQQYFGPNSRPSSTSPIMSNQIETIKAKLTKVQNANAQVPKPIDEVTAVGQAPYNFIQWPKRLLQLVSNKAIEVSKKDDIPSKRLNFQLNYVEQLMSENDPTYPQVHIQKKMYEDKRNCYLAPYLKK
uniref:Uncharacterized protein LOC105851516 isoform X2 n=1 Tax=Cicer arietinum TaxID=3827 RepID=A0A3Q7XE37_CICAR|nr:uncharacterized protein LOC105851516 isoform X2 [Cicer arietinum]